MTERTRLEYTDLRITLHRARVDGDTVTVGVFAGNNADTSVDVTFSKSTFWEGSDEHGGLLDLLEADSITMGDLYDLGEELARIALPTNAPAEGELSAREQFLRGEAAADATTNGALRIRLVVFDPLLTQLPWEYLAVRQSATSSTDRDFLALRRRVSIVRAGPTVAALPPPAAGRLNVTALLANPGRPFRDLDLGKDREALENAAAEAGDEGARPVEIEYVSPPTVGKLVTAIDDRTNVFYFGGHGQLEKETTNLILEKDDEEPGPDPYSAKKLGQLLAGRKVRLAFLGACDTGRPDGSSPWAGAADELMRARVPFVIAFQAAVLDRAAGVTARYVWKYAMSGFAIDQAITDARSEVLHTTRDSPAEWGKVVLYLADDAGDQVFSVAAADEALRLRDVLSEEFATWLASRTGSTRTTLFRSAVAETAHDVVALEPEADEFEDPLLEDNLASPYRPFKHFSYRQRRAFERADLSAKLCTGFDQSHALLVSGPAGSGKTSLLLAGLGPHAVAAGHGLIRIAEYAGLAGRLATDLSDLGLADLPSSADMPTVVDALERNPPPAAPVVILDQLEQVIEPAEAQPPEVDGDIGNLIRAAGRGLIKLVLVTRPEGANYLRGPMSGEADLAWKPIEVPYLTHDEALAAIEMPRARLEKTIHYAPGIPERIATELNPQQTGIQPGLLAVLCDRLWHEARESGPEGGWSIDKPAAGGVARVLATALDRFLEDELAGLSDAAKEVLGSADLFEASPWAQLDEGTDSDHARAIERLVQLGLLAQRTRTLEVTEYRYSGPAVRDLVVRSQPWMVRRQLDAQETLESISLDWKRGLVPSRGHVAYVAAAAERLHPTLEQCTLLIRASLIHRLDPAVWVKRAAALAGEDGANREVAKVDAPGAVVDWESESGRLLGVPEGEEIAPPSEVGPYTWWAINGPDRTARLTAGLVASVNDFGGRLNEAVVGTGSTDSRTGKRRVRQLWAALDDIGRRDASDAAMLSAFDKRRVALSNASLRLSRNQRELGIHSRRVGLTAALLLGLLQMVNWLLLDWPNWTRFTESLGEFFEFFFVGGLLGAALGAGMYLPTALGYGGRRQAFLSGAAAFTVMSVLLELSNGREFWRRPTTMFAMAAAGTLIAAVALSAGGPETKPDGRPRWRDYGTMSTVAAAAAIAVMHWLIRLPDDIRWKGRLFFAKSRDNYFSVFNQLHDSEAPVEATQFVVMSLLNTVLAALILAGAAVYGRRSAQRTIEELRRTEERVPAGEPPSRDG